MLPGARVPVDGVVTSGKSHADESMLTGEAEAVLKTLGDAVIGGTMNLGGTLQAREVAHARQMRACLSHQNCLLWEEPRRLSCCIQAS